MLNILRTNGGANPIEQPIINDRSKGNLPRVFLSYSRSDQKLIKMVADALSDHGFWPDFDQSNYDPHFIDGGISAEDEWWLRVQEMIAGCDVMVFFASQKSIRSPTCEEEIAYAREISKRVIVVKAGDIDLSKAPPRVAAMNVKIDFSCPQYNSFKDAINILIDALSVDLPWLREGKRLASKVQEWDSNSQPEDLLRFGQEIIDAEAWQSNRPLNHPVPGSLLLKFIAESRELEARREQQRREQIEERERQIKRISFQQKIGGLGLFVFTLIVLTTAIYTVKNMTRVGQAESDMIARSAQSALESGDSQTALKLATLASRETILNPTTDFSEITLLNAAGAAHTSGGRGVGLAAKRGRNLIMHHRGNLTNSHQMLPPNDRAS